MKLSRETIDKIIAVISSDCETYEEAVEELENLNLVFKSGDASHSVLVEQKFPEKTWGDIYDKRK